MLAVTGTDGKTTTTMMVGGACCEAAGLRAAAVGNTEVPLVAALDDDVDAFAVECSSFRLTWMRSFRTEAAIWLNLAPDHQNWHTSMQSLRAGQGATCGSCNGPTTSRSAGCGDATVMRRSGERRRAGT